jgi:transposase-like protein
MVGRKNAEKELRWREILERYADSGVSVREFCVSEGVSEPSFYAWRKKLGMEERQCAGAASQGPPRPV